MRAIEQLGIRLALLILTALTGMAMILLVAPAGVVGVLHDAVKSRA